MNDHLVRILTEDGSLRATAALTTAVAEETRHRQQTDPTASVALGRLLTGGALLGCLLKGKQRLALLVEGNGPLGRLSVETDAAGRLRGAIRNPRAGLPPQDGRFDVAGAIGKAGFLHVWKDLGLKEPYQSMVQLQSSEIAEDLAWYLTSSEQIPSSVALGVELDRTGEVAAAGGFLVQSLPPGDETQVELLVKRLRHLPPTTSMLRQGLTPGQILERLFSGTGFLVQAEVPLRFHCPCNRRQIEGVLTALGKDELLRLAEEQQQVEVACEYCRQIYRFPREQVRALAG